MVDIAFVTKRADTIGGVQNIVREVATVLTETGANVHVISFGDSVSSKLSQFGGLCGDILRIAKLNLANPNGRIVYTVTGYQLILFSLISLLFSRKFYFWEHGDPEFFDEHLSSRLLRKYLYRYASGVVVLHDDFAKRVGLYSACVSVIPNPVPQPDCIAVKCGQGKVIDRIIWVGRISPEKQPEKAFDSMMLSAATLPGVSHYFISPGAQTGRPLPALPPNLRVVDGNKFEFRDWFSPTTVFLLTSTREAMPGVVFEAASMSASIVSTHCSPWIATIAEYVNIQILRSNFTSQEVVHAISKCIANSETCDEKLERRNEFLSGLSRAKIAQRWINQLQ